MEKETEDDFVAVPLNTQRKKRKRREAHVHFAHFGVATVDADSQTEVSIILAGPQGPAQDYFSGGQCCGRCWVALPRTHNFCPAL